MARRVLLLAGVISSACAHDGGLPPSDTEPVPDTPAAAGETETTWLRRMTYSEYTDTITTLLRVPVLLEYVLPRDYPV